MTIQSSFAHKANEALCNVSCSEIARGFSRAAYSYNASAKVQKPIAEFAIHRLNQIRAASDESIIDLGCGTSLKLKEIKANTSRYIGLDLASGMLEKARMSAKLNEVDNAHFVNANAAVLPFQANSFDLVFSSMALQWCQAKYDVIAEIKRILRTRGRAVLAILVDGSFNELESAWADLSIPSRLNCFANTQSWLDAIKQNKLQCSVEEQDFFQYFDNSLGMLKSLKAIGADTQLSSSRFSAITKSELKKLDLLMRNRQPSIAHSESEESVGSDKLKSLALTYKVAFFTVHK